MDAERLEELAALATSESKYFTYRGPCTEQDLRDLARCAAAWAKVERHLADNRSSSLGGVDVGNGPSWAWWVDDDTPIIRSTAIEAVEAAPEVKP
jgi:hypothetical protein